jgi:type IV pilus assembly protein PilB
LRGRDDKFIQLLRDEKILSDLQLDQLIQDKPNDVALGEWLVRKNIITEQKYAEFISVQLGTPRMDILQIEIDQQVLKEIPKEFAKRNLVMPIAKKNNKLQVAMVNPNNLMTINDVRMMTGLQIERFVATKPDILFAINRHYGMDIDVSIEEIEQNTTFQKEVVVETVNAVDSPIIRIVTQLITEANLQQASDIHIEPQEHQVIIRFRVDGILKKEKTFAKQMLPSIITRIKIMANLDITESRLPQDGRFYHNAEGANIDVRVSILPTVFGEKINMRLLNPETAMRKLDEMGFHNDNIALIKNVIEKPNGLILITGPTGSGKTSTLNAILKQISNETVSIFTIEDPVEYRMEGMNQTQVNPSIGLTFASGLRTILRQDPNIIMVGEIRDRETAEIVVRASLTGHFVLSTVHTNDAFSTINRLIDMGVEAFLVASSLTGVISQRLIRKVCTDCSYVSPPTVREVELVRSYGYEIKQIVRGKGCTQCNFTGYKGRTAVHEVFIVDDEIRRMIMDYKPTSEIRAVARQKGTRFLVEDGIQKVVEGISTIEEVLRIATWE